MKNKFLFSVIMFITLVGAMFLFTGTSYAGSQTMNNLQYDVQLNEDGSANVTETWDMEVYDTNTLFKTFNLDSSKYSGITNVSVVEVLSSGQITDFIKTNSYAYHVQKGYFYALNTNSREFEIAWGVSISRNTTKKYRISYTIKDVVKTYNDCSEFYWQFLGTSNGIPCDNITGTVKLPSAVESKDNIKVWAHGPLNGEIYSTDNQTVSFNVKYVEIKTMVEVRIAVLENIFTANTNIVNSNKLQSIISEETTWADEANRERDALRSQQQRREKEQRDRILFVVRVLIVVFMFFLFIIIKYIRELRNTKKLEPETRLEYYRDFPDDEATPAEAAFLYYFDKEEMFKKNISKIVSGTILDLALKKIIIFEVDSTEQLNIILDKGIDKKNLKIDELTVYNVLQETLEYKNRKNDDNKISMKDIEQYAKNNDKTFLSSVNSIETKVASIQELKKNYDIEMSKTSKKWKNKGTGYTFATFAPLVLFIGGAHNISLLAFAHCLPCIICAILCRKIANKVRTQTLTQKGVNEQEQWKGLKNYMENFSLLNEREVPELVLWEKYLVYATAFGVADKVLKQLKVKYPELMDENYMISNGYMYMYMINRYNFDRMINAGMQSAYNVGMRAKAAREAAASSSYSSGGGRRRRILWRRRTAVEAGRTEWGGR